MKTDTVRIVDQPAFLTEALIAFLKGGVSIIVASCDAANRPLLGRALGCEVSADGRRLTVFLDGVANSALLAAIASTGRIAAVVNEPSSHRSIQFKGLGAELAPADESAGPILERHIAGFGRDVARIGFDEAFTRTLMAHDPRHVVAVTFAPIAVFNQTPGPRAGSPLEL